MDARWEYRLVATPMGRHGPTEIEDILNRYGAEGWELVDIDNNDTMIRDSRNGSFVFKRRIPGCPGCGAALVETADSARLVLAHETNCWMRPGGVVDVVPRAPVK